MCLNLSDVETVFSEKLHDQITPIKTDIQDIKGTLDKIIEIQMQQIKLEGQVLNLQERERIVKQENDEVFTRLRHIETDGDPKPTCQTIFNNFDRSIDFNTKKLESQDKTIKDRTWQMLFAFISLGLTMIGGLSITIVGGTLLYIVKGGAI